MEVGLDQAVVTRRSHEYTTRANERIEHLVIETVVATEVLARAFAEGRHTGHVALGSIVEEILEPERIEGIGVEIEPLGRNHRGIVARGVGHKADVALVGHAAVGRAVAIAGSDARGVGAVGLVVAVGRMSASQHIVAMIGGAHGHSPVVGSEHVPHRADAAAVAEGIEKGGMGIVEAYVLDAYHYAFAGKSLGQRLGTVGLVGTQYDRHRIEGGAVGTVGLDALDLRKRRQPRDAAHGDADDVDVAKAGKRLAATGVEHSGSVAVNLDEGAKPRGRMGTHALHAGCRRRGVESQRAHHGRHLGKIGALGIDSRHHDP